MRTTQAASRLGVDASTVIGYINWGLSRPGKSLKWRLMLAATRKGRAWDISADAVRLFARLRKQHGL